MKLALITTNIVKHDAASNHTIKILEEFGKNQNYKVHFYTFSIDTDIPARVELSHYSGKNEHNIKSVIISLTRIYSLARDLSKYDVLIAVGPDITIIPSIHMAKRFNSGLKLVWISHAFTPIGFWRTIRDKILYQIRNKTILWSMKHSDWIIVMSNYVRDTFPKEVDKRKIKVIPFGIDVSRFYNTFNGDLRKRYCIEGKFIMLFVGQLIPHKRVDFLINALQFLDEDIVLLVVGSGHCKDRLTDIVRALKLEERVYFAGKVTDDDLPKYYAAADIFVTASSHEGFCVPIIEAFASGKTAVAPNITAMPETIGDAGMVYDFNSSNDFVSKVHKLKTDTGYRDELSRNAKKRAQIFDIKNMLMEYSGFIHSIIENEV